MHAYVKLAVVGMGLVACGDPTTEGPPPVYLDAVVAAGPANGLSAQLVVRATGYDSASARYWTDGEPVAETPRNPFGADSTSRFPVLGLLADRPYHIEVNLVAEGAAAAVDTVHFTTDTLPDWIPGAVAVGSDTTPGFLALSYPQGAVILDNQARPVWYLFNPDGVLNSFQAHPNGTYTAFRLSDSPAQFRVLDVLGAQTGTLGCVGRATRFHDIVVGEGGDYWIMCDDSVVTDLSAFGGQADATVIWTVLQHVSASGTLLWEWNAGDHFAITEVPPNRRSGSEVNATHGNSIAFDVDGHLLISFRSMDEITKIHAATGAVLWRFGGLANAFQILDDPFNGFQQQHGVRMIAPDTIQMLDNRLAAPSRLVRYALDTDAMTATLVLDFRDAPTTHTPVGGSTEFYPNGHAVVTFGRAGRVVEISEGGLKVWELTGIDNTYVFRVLRIPSLYHPQRLGVAGH